MPEISIGFGPVNVKLNFSLSWWQKLKRWWSGPDPKSATYIFLNHTYLYIPQEDEGSIRFYLSIVNASKTNIIVDKIVINHWQCNENILPDICPNIIGIGKSIARYAVDNIVLTLPLDSKLINNIRKLSRPARNYFCSPEIIIKLSAQLFLADDKGNIGFNINAPFSQIYVCWESNI